MSEGEGHAPDAARRLKAANLAESCVPRSHQATVEMQFFTAKPDQKWHTHPA